MPCVSVIVPIFNMKEFLPRCMSKLILQNYFDYEIILVDDGSTDGSSEMCDWYAEMHSNLVRCIHKTNGGLSSARNAGMDVAQGEYVIFPDPDDWVENNYLERLVALQKQYTVDLVCTGHFIDYDDRSIEANRNQTLRLISSKEAQKALLISPCMGGFAWNKLFHLKIIRLHNLRFLDDVGTTEDLDFAFRYLQYCKEVCFAPEIRTYHYYQRSGAATHGGFSVKKLQAIRTYEKILATSGATSDIGKAAKEDICNTAINLIPMYWNSDEKDVICYQKIRNYIKMYYSDYLKSSRYSKGRKLQAIFARYIPKTYCKIKNVISRE